MFALVPAYPWLYFGMYAGDGVIHLVYVENAARGNWYEFNPGEKSAGIGMEAGFFGLLVMLWFHQLSRQRAYLGGGNAAAAGAQRRDRQPGLLRTYNFKVDKATLDFFRAGKLDLRAYLRFRGIDFLLFDFPESLSIIPPGLNPRLRNLMPGGRLEAEGAVFQREGPGPWVKVTREGGSGEVGVPRQQERQLPNGISAFRGGEERTQRGLEVNHASTFSAGNAARSF